MAEKQTKKNSAKEREENDILALEWSAPEYEYSPKSKEWYIMLGSVCVSLLIIAIYFKNLLMGVLIFTGGFTIAIMAGKKPKIVKIGIDTRGITMEKQMYSYKNIKSFWVEYEPPKRKEIILTLKEGIMPVVKIPLGKSNPNEVRKFVLRFAKEIEYEYTFTDALAERLKL